MTDRLDELRPAVYEQALADTELFRQLALPGLVARAAAPSALERAKAPEYEYLDDFLRRGRGLMNVKTASPSQRVAAAVLEASVFLFASGITWLKMLSERPSDLKPSSGISAIGDLISGVATDANLIELSDRRLGEIIDHEIRMNEVVASLGVPESTLHKYPDLFEYEERPPSFPGCDFYDAISLSAFIESCFEEPLERSFEERGAFASAWDDAFSLSHVVFHDRFAGRKTPIDDLPLTLPRD